MTPPRRSYHSRDHGYERAMEHIRQAEELTKELGGTDQDVKDYLFSLPKEKMQVVLDRYQSQYGYLARDYAEQTLPKWRSGSVKMSGMVAERLFNLLPPLMPIDEKYKLAESLWKHVAPSSHRRLYFGPDVDPEELANVAREHFQKKAVPHQLPDSVQRRFHWLSSGDIGVKQQLLNHFMEHERALAAHAVRENTQVILDNLRGESGDVFHADMTLKVGKHTLVLSLCHGVEGISDVPVEKPRSKKADTTTKGKHDDSWWIFLLVSAGVLAILHFLSTK